MKLTIEPGLARGFWVVDSEDTSDETHCRYMKWFATKEQANAHVEGLKS